MSEIFEQLEINKTFFVEFFLFVGFFVLLSSIYLKPFQKIIEKRMHKLKEEAQGSTDLMREVEGKLASYELELARSRHEALKNYEKVVAEVKAEEDAAVNAYKDNLKREYLKLTEQFQKERKQVEEDLKKQVEEFSDVLAERAVSGK